MGPEESHTENSNRHEKTEVRKSNIEGMMGIDGNGIDGT